MTTSKTDNGTVSIGRARIDLKDVAFGNVTLDEVLLESSEIRIDPPEPGEPAAFSSGETTVRAVMSEANLNRLAALSLPSDAPVRDLRISLLTGKARISGKVLVSIVPLPFTIEAVARVLNGTRVMLDCRSATVGIDLPKPVVQLIEQKLNEALRLDVGGLDIPVFIEDVRCEPGRLVGVGRARIAAPTVGAGERSVEMCAPEQAMMNAGMDRAEIVEGASTAV